jgi:pSer/pThr/pTyr-binding forkhead associated (FHA) protein
MQNCWNCSAQQIDGAIFCSECGANLLDNSSRRETTTSLGQRPGSNPLPVEQVAEEPTPTRSDAHTQGISLLVADTGQRIWLEAERDLLVGRTDESRGIFPQLDLTNIGGYDAGVSRRHAMLSCYNGTCMVEDLGSANGTFLNDRRLPANQPTRVIHGDELKFATLLLRVELPA